jgi:uncharacterized membrane protein
MAASWEKALARWVEAGLLDATAAERIRGFEASREGTPRLRWTSILALAFGGILLSAGVLLFVSAHWDEMPPFTRMSLITAVVAVLHAAGSQVRFPALRSALHAVGTVSFGGAIAMAGQVFHMHEHWPSGILLWALGAWSGVWLLRDWPQITLAALLTPAWIYGEVQVRTEYRTVESTSCFFFLTALAYMSAGGAGRTQGWQRALMVTGTVAVVPSAAAILTTYGDPKRTFGYAIALAVLPVLLAVWLRGRKSVAMLPWLAWTALAMFACYERLEVLVYVLYAAGSVLMIRWGMQEGRAERVNIGIAGFAMTVLAFYFSNVMNSLDRSLSLIVLGVLFLAGGWQLERVRRRLLTQIRGEGS